MTTLEIPAGRALAATLATVLQDGRTRLVHIWLVEETADEWRHFPGDVVYPKSDWHLLRVSGSKTLREVQAELDVAFERYWSARRPGGV